MAPHPLVNSPAPEFSIPDANGEMFKFPPGQKGSPLDKPTVLFFYPMSGTYGCTREACQFRDALAEKEIFKRTDVQVIGISADPVQKQKQFVESQNLTYPVLSDEDHVAHKAYQVGKGLLGLTNARMTFVIDKEGIVRDSLSATMNYSAHVTFVQKALEKLASEGKQQTSEAHPEGGNALSSPSREELGRVANVVTA